jgi:hypothetical protein
VNANLSAGPDLDRWIAVPDICNLNAKVNVSTGNDLGMKGNVLANSNVDMKANARLGFNADLPDRIFTHGLMSVRLSLGFDPNVSTSRFHL